VFSCHQVNILFKVTLDGSVVLFSADPWHSVLIKEDKEYHLLEN
jgi:hypothetical protein